VIEKAQLKLLKPLALALSPLEVVIRRTNPNLVFVFVFLFWGLFGTTRTVVDNCDDMYQCQDGGAIGKLEVGAPKLEKCETNALLRSSSSSRFLRYACMLVP